MFWFFIFFFKLVIIDRIGSGNGGEKNVLLIDFWLFLVRESCEFFFFLYLIGIWESF